MKQIIRLELSKTDQYLRITEGQQKHANIVVTFTTHYDSSLKYYLNICTF